MFFLFLCWKILKRQKIFVQPSFHKENHVTYFVCNAVHIFIAFFVDKEDPRLEISAA